MSMLLASVDVSEETAHATRRMDDIINADIHEPILDDPADHPREEGTLVGLNMYELLTSDLLLGSPSTAPMNMRNSAIPSTSSGEDSTTSDLGNVCQPHRVLTPTRFRRKPNRVRRKDRCRGNSRRTKMVHSSSSSSSGSDSDEETKDIRDALTCPVCLDVFLDPFRLSPCGHNFCETCLRRLARNNPTNTPCPLCRQTISTCEPNAGLLQQVRKHFPSHSYERREVEQRSRVYHLPLPWQPRFTMQHLLAHHGSGTAGLNGSVSGNNNDNNNGNEGRLRTLLNNMHAYLPTVTVLFVLNFISVAMFLLSYYLFSYLPGILYFCGSYVFSSWDGVLKGGSVDEDAGGNKVGGVNVLPDYLYTNMAVSVVVIWIIHAGHQRVVEWWRR